MCLPDRRSKPPRPSGSGAEPGAAGGRVCRRRRRAGASDYGISVEDESSVVSPAESLRHLQQLVAFAFADDLIEQHEVDEFEETVRKLAVSGPAVDAMHHIKVEVWRRDGGACVDCSASEYLEFDHVIPWSRGGATSVGNLQLRCRKCNLAKGARI